jgi:hypothetical protein
LLVKPVKPVKPKSSWFILNVLVKSQVFSGLASHFTRTFLVDSENPSFSGMICHAWPQPRSPDQPSSNSPWPDRDIATWHPSGDRSARQGRPGVSGFIPRLGKP